MAGSKGKRGGGKAKGGSGDFTSRTVLFGASDMMASRYAEVRVVSSLILA
eukprot:CAMPEP_0114144658 /NCGR_PEP_ID=MMETSP0043_2-20121206/19642_1 /TAXON_ID=464988 /ORGANISM="Hemiselmis andersenii, Strain CCMP644" /LENGTH=49 /DNA_ID=CAMNT_0001239047 /DNA_START=158 /DNA_END=307 /DNA_ORIENTATION=+